MQPSVLHQIMLTEDNLITHELARLLYGGRMTEWQSPERASAVSV
jgi:hypothetical protein